MARQLLLIRHGSVAPPFAGRYIGRTDAPLGDAGRREAASLAALVRARKPGAVFCSPLSRARHTCELLLPEKITPTFDPDLSEIDFGRWENKTFGEIAADDPQSVDLWANLPADFAFPGGESIAAFAARVANAARRLIAHPADVVMAVTHGGVIRAMLCQLLGLQAKQYMVFNVRCGTCATLNLFDGQAVLDGFNETANAEVSTWPA